MVNQFRVYIGTYTKSDSEGIYVYQLDTSTGKLEPSSVTAGMNNPSFLAIHPTKRYLYAVAEQDECGGAINAYSIDSATGELSYLNQQPTKTSGPCHLSVDASGRVVVVANYQGGAVTALLIGSDGRLSEASDFIQHEGSSVNLERQQEPHPHSANMDPTNRYVLVPDLGLDKVVVYKLDTATGRLTLNSEPGAKVSPGAGPRHFAFHPNGKWAYVINEIGSTFTAFKYDGARGALDETQTISTLPDEFTDVSHCADCHVSPDGRFLYGSNRGHDSIVIFAIDPETGALSYVDHEPTGGKWPRNFAIDPTGSLLLAANEHSDDIVTFWIDRETGKLRPTGHRAEVPSPVCLKLVPVS